MWRHLVIGIVLSGLLLWAQKKPSSSPAKTEKAGAVESATNPQLIQFAKVEHDFGKIKEEDKVATTRFTFKNTHKHPVKIVDVKTSCGCTSPSWSREPIAPGKEGYVEAQYSAWGRPGAFVKTLTVRVRSEADTTKEETYTLTIKGEVLPRPKGPEDWYPTKLGNLRFGPANHVSFGTIKTNEKKSQRITIYNDSDKPIELKGFADVPKHVEVSFITLKGPVPTHELKPKDTVQVEVKYDAGAANDYGFVYHLMKIQTNDATEPDKPLYVTANIEEYFGELTEAALAEAPRAQFEQTEYNYGKIKAGDKVTHEFRLTNTGKKPLIIRKVKASCGCTVAAPEKSELKPGESTSIKVTFDSTGRAGKDSKSVTVITNDPRQPTINLVIHGEIEAAAK
jgi:archaellin